MFERLGRAVFRLRFVIVVAWVALAAVSVLFAPSLSKVGSADQTSFLPGGTESMQARSLIARVFPAEAADGTATVVFTRPAGLTDADRAAIAGVETWVTSKQAPASLQQTVKSVVGAAGHPELASSLRSKDGQMELLQVQLRVGPFLPAANLAAADMRAYLASGASLPGGLQANVTGGVGIGADYLDAIKQATDRTTLVTVVLVLVVLLLIYRAPLAALVPLLTIGAAFLVGRGLLGELAQAGWKISSLLDTFVVVLVFGVGTDYTIFLISRFREEVSGGTSWHDAIGATEKRIGAVITASAATVVVGLGSMAVGRFGMFQTTGPALALAVVVTLLAGLTLAPALLGIFGHYLFWPRHDRDVSAEADRGFFARLARLIARRPALVTVVVLAFLVVPAMAVPALKQNFDVLADLPAGSDSKVGFDLVAKHLDKGELMPADVLVEASSGTQLASPASLARVAALTAQLAAVQGVRSVRSVVAPGGDGTTPDSFRPSRQLAALAKQFASPTDPAAGLQNLLKPETASGLTSAAAYVDALGVAFPDMTGRPDLKALSSDLVTMPTAIGQLRASGRVSDQLARLAQALTAPPAAGTSPAATLEALSGYLAELGAAYPQAAASPPFQDLEAALASGATPPDAARLARDLGELAAAFQPHPEALLFPRSLPASAEAAAAQATIAQASARLPAEFASLSAAFAARRDDYYIPTGLGGNAGTAAQQVISAYVSPDGAVTRLYVVPKDDPYATGAFDTVRRVRDAALASAASFGGGTRTLVGGPTAEQTDLQATIANDFRDVALLTIVGIFLVLVLLLRAVVAPLYLVGTVLLSYLCTLGLTSTFFQSVLGQSGINYFIPLLVFVLLVALGSDYNIFLMSRVREEAERRGTRDGIRAASARTGAVITSAGVILAGTFLAMVASPLTILFQVGVTVAVGVLIDTFVVRSLLVPAITMLLGDAAWWPFGRPGRAAQPQPPPAARDEPTEAQPVGT